MSGKLSKTFGSKPVYFKVGVPSQSTRQTSRSKKHLEKRILKFDFSRHLFFQVRTGSAV